MITSGTNRRTSTRLIEVQAPAQTHLEPELLQALSELLCSGPYVSVDIVYY